jgi:DNA polymerase III epsilon subunit family exonuclease
MAHFRDSSIPEEERLNAGQKRIYRFVLEDFTGEISGVFFPKKGEEDLLEKVAENSTVIVCGDIKDVSLFGISIRIKSLSFCTLPDEWEEKIDYKKEKSYYEYVFPEDMVYTDQVGLFSLGGEPEVAPYLKQHDIVVFDFETTGKYPYGGDKIIEIGAVKVINGAITQKFHTLVDPKMHIPEESTLIHHLTDADVAGAITADKALQDFYKFTRGCVLSGYNIVGFDCHFLNIEGKQSRYNFDNPVIDVYPLAQRNVKGIKNYKLGTVSKALGVTLDNAHSALYDTIATAEVLIKLAKYI